MIQYATRFLHRYSHLNWAIADQAIVSGANFSTSLLLARFLGLEEFGRFTLAWMAVLFVNSLQNAIIISPMMSIGPKQPKNSAAAYYGTIVVQQLIFATFVAVVLFGFTSAFAVQFPHWNIDDFALPLAAVAFFFQLQDFTRRYFFTIGRGHIAFIVDAVRYFGQVALLIGIFQFADLNSVDILWIIAAMAVVSCLLGAFRFEALSWSHESFLKITSRHWEFSRWLIGSSLMQWASTSVFTLVAGGILGPKAVGALAAARNLMGVVHILHMGLENFLPNRTSWYLHHRGKLALFKFTKRVALSGGLITMSIAIIASVAPDLWLRIIYGNEFEGFGYLLQWYALNSVIAFMVLPVRFLLRAFENTKAIFISYLCTSTFGLLSVYPIISHFGIGGAAYGVVMVNMILASSMFIQVLATPHSKYDRNGSSGS